MVSIDSPKTLTVVTAEIDDGSGSDAATPRVPPNALRQRLGASLKGLMPRRLFTRSLLIIVTPVILIQAVVTYIFFQEHWNTVTSRLSESVAGDIAMVIELYEDLSEGESIDSLNRLTRRTTKLNIALNEGERLPKVQKPATFSVLDSTLRSALEDQIDEPFWFDTTGYPQFVDIRVQLGDDVLRVIAERDRVFATTGNIFILWMVGTTFAILSIAIVFLRNQVRSIQKLADAAESFGKGREVPTFKPTGATEVRRAAEAFIEMRDRIQRQIDQRTMLLAGVSHDLRTPLTRMRLQLEMMRKGEEVDDLIADLSDMDHMLEEYLAFARGQGGEATTMADIGGLVNEVAERARRTGRDIGVDLRGELWLTVRRNALKRCIANLIDNALEFGNRVAVIVARHSDRIEIIVDDDGPGIPEDEIEAAFKPFNRLDESRNLDKGGVGLGLAIARDVARGHGGDVTLERSPWGGLRAKVVLPV